MKSFKTQMIKLMGSRKGQRAVSADALTDKIIGVVVFAFLGAALVPIALNAFANLSGSGIALASLFGTVLGILLAVFVFKGIMKGLK